MRRFAIALFALFWLHNPAHAGAAEDLLAQALRRAMVAGPSADWVMATLAGRPWIVAVMGSEAVVDAWGARQVVIAEKRRSGRLLLLTHFPSTADEDISLRQQGASIHLRRFTAHHGWHAQSVRLGVRGHRLMIVGTSVQSLELLDDGTHEFWSGSSTDLAAARAQVWGWRVPLRRLKDGAVVSRVSAADFEDAGVPAGRRSHRLALRHTAPAPLSQLRDDTWRALFPCAHVDSTGLLRRTADGACLR
jgi:hypothetical protein